MKGPRLKSATEAIDSFPSQNSPVTSERVAAQIISQIRAGTIKPGQKLPPERHLATELGVSRGSLREALKGLEYMGLVGMRQGGGVFVSSLEAAELLRPLRLVIDVNRSNLTELFRAREYIDSILARDISRNASGEAIADLDALVQEQNALLDDPVAYRASDIQFHRRLLSLCDNSYLSTISEALFLAGTEFRKLAFETRSILERSLSDHETIIAALRTGNEANVRDAIVGHSRTFFESSLEVMGDQEIA